MTASQFIAEIVDSHRGQLVMVGYGFNHAEVSIFVWVGTVIKSNISRPSLIHSRVVLFCLRYAQRFIQLIVFSHPLPLLRML